MTSINIASYLNVHGFDETIVDLLSAVDQIQPVEGDANLASLALQLLNEPRISAEIRVQLVRSLGLPQNAIAATSLTTDGHPTLPGLLTARLVPDDPAAFTCLGEDEEDIKEAVISVSDTFAQNMTAISLTPNDLRMIASRPVPAVVKNVLLTEYATFEPTLAKHGARYLAEWAASNDQILAGDVIVSLATKAGGRGATAIMNLLGMQAASIDLQYIFAALNALEGDYPKLVNPGREQAKISVTPGVSAVLQRLQSDGPVSKISLIDKGQVYKVTRHQS